MIATLLLGVLVTLAPKGEMDMTSALMNAVDQVREAKRGEIRLKAGTYHFRSPQAMRFYVSNHDNPMPRNVFLPITNVENLVISASPRAEFVFHGEGIALALIDTKRVTAKGIGVDWDRPYFNEVSIESVGEDGRAVIYADPKQFPLELNEKGKIIAVGEGWKKNPLLLEVFDGVKLSRTGGTWLDGAAESLGGNRFRLMQDMRKVRFVSPLKKGDFATFRSPWRPNPAILLYRAVDTMFVDYVVHASAGMGLIAQRSENVMLRGTGKVRDKHAGSFARACTRRHLSLQADATHFSNCKGTIMVENCLFEGMNDDAINVHSTCLKIERLDAPNKILCRYKHNQSIGFEVFLPGEMLRVIKARTMEPRAALIRVADAKMLKPNEVLLTLEKELPAGIGVGDAVENADWQPAVIFRNNVVRNSSPRATLFTTPGKIVCEGNVFEHISAQAIHMSADTWDWFESGTCRDITIRNNIFRDVAILGGKGVIQIDPNVQDLAAQKERYHRNIVIEENTFEGNRVPLLYARSAENLTWRNNTVKGEAKFDIQYCENIKGIPHQENEQ